MRTAIRRTFTTAVATSVVLLAVAGAASAQGLRIRDVKHDMWAGAASDQPSQFRAAPHRATGDVLSVRLRHGPHNVVVTERFARLDRSGQGDLYGFRLRTDERVWRDVQVQAYRRSGWGGTLSMFRRNGRSVSCDRLVARIDYGRDLLRLRVPRRCLGDPQWVQLSAVDAHITLHGTWVVDNPHNNEASFSGWSPRVSR
ncbi:MAG TPA: hypothetical protein VFJ09_02340 [Nocardioidaceae bacterium]|nr:hypothetical protein [Nocardioidaceae bacterium]